MSAFFLAIPLTIFMLFVAPIWLWLHYSRQNNSDATLAPGERQRLQQLNQDARQMRERIQALEEILDAENPDWRQQ